MRGNQEHITISTINRHGEHPLRFEQFQIDKSSIKIVVCDLRKIIDTSDSDDCMG